MILPGCDYRGPLRRGKYDCTCPLLRVPADGVSAETCQRCPYATVDPEVVERRRQFVAEHSRPAVVALAGGPGTELIRIYAAMGVPSCHACRDLAGRMDEWGSDGCRERLDQIVEEMLPRARQWVAENRPWVHRMLPDVIEDAAIRSRIKADILAAIAAAEALPDET